MILMFPREANFPRSFVDLCRWHCPLLAFWMLVALFPLSIHASMVPFTSYISFISLLLSFSASLWRVNWKKSCHLINDKLTMTSRRWCDDWSKTSNSFCGARWMIVMMMTLVIMNVVDNNEWWSMTNKIMVYLIHPFFLIRTSKFHLRLGKR